MSATVCEQLAVHVAEFPFDAIPDPALESAKRLAIDTLAVAWAGTDAPGIGAVRDMLVAEGGTPVSTVWGTGHRSTPRNAAFLNSAAAAALDFDGMRATPRGSVHSDSVVVPAALAVAEHGDRSGSELLAALALGNDVVTRLGAGSALPHKGWYHTSIYGVFGAAAAASRLMGLDAGATCHALGLAAHQASATQLPNIERTLAKRYSSSLAAQAGVLAAMLASKGITAARAAFEGRYGFYDLYQPGDPGLVLEGLGRTWPHETTGIKRYPCCACCHTAIEAALLIAQDTPTEPSAIDGVAVHISPYVHRLVGDPFDPARDAQVAAQFSVQYAVASALIRRRFGVADIQEEAIRDPAVSTLARRIRVTVEPEWGNSRGATVRLRTRHGIRHERHVEHIPGSSAAPLGADDIRLKALDCLRSGRVPLSVEKADLLIGRIGRLASLERANDLLAGLI